MLKVLKQWMAILASFDADALLTVKNAAVQTAESYDASKFSSTNQYYNQIQLQMHMERNMNQFLVRNRCHIWDLVVSQSRYE